MTLRALAPVPLTALLACSTVSATAPAGDTRRDPQAAPAPALVAPPHGATSAGDLGGAAAPDRDAAALAALRAEGPAALARLLAAHDATRDPEARARLAATIDKVAGQRYATLSRLYWYEDLDQARAVARASGKPILSLRMLGRLDEDLSCANSRFFRTILYPDPAVRELLGERFVLHWSSERQVPRITVDFGDGRALVSTVTGNSAHYVLDADGRPLDVLPGMYAPEVFRRELTTSLALHAALAGEPARARARRLVEHHEAARRATQARWAALPKIAVLAGGRALLTDDVIRQTAEAAQRATMMKAYVEVPMLRTVDLGLDPGELPDDLELWAEIGQALLGVGAAPDPALAAAAATDPWQVAPVGRAQPAPGKAGPVQPPAASPKRRAAPRPILSAEARRLVDSLLAAPGATPLADAARAAVIARLEQTLVADTALNEVRLRPQIRGRLVHAYAQGDVSFTDLNAWVYANVFHTPAEDAWLGLLPRDTYTGLAGGAIIAGT